MHQLGHLRGMSNADRIFVDTCLIKTQHRLTELKEMFHDLPCDHPDSGLGPPVLARCVSDEYSQADIEDARPCLEALFASYAKPQETELKQGSLMRLLTDLGMSSKPSHALRMQLHTMFFVHSSADHGTMLREEFVQGFACVVPISPDLAPDEQTSPDMLQATTSSIRAELRRHLQMIMAGDQFFTSTFAVLYDWCFWHLLSQTTRHVRGRDATTGGASSALPPTDCEVKNGSVVSEAEQTPAMELHVAVQAWSSLLEDKWAFLPQFLDFLYVQSHLYPPLEVISYPVWTGLLSLARDLKGDLSNWKTLKEMQTNKVWPVLLQEFATVLVPAWSQE
jgi:hypothetical protein